MTRKIGHDEKNVTELFDDVVTIAVFPGQRVLQFG